MKTLLQQCHINPRPSKYRKLIYKIISKRTSYCIAQSWNSLLFSEKKCQFFLWKIVLFLKYTKKPIFFKRSIQISQTTLVSEKLMLKLVEIILFERDLSSHHSMPSCLRVSGLYYHICCIIVSSNCLSMIYLWRCSLRLEKQSLSAGKSANMILSKERTGLWYIAGGANNFRPRKVKR